MNALEIAVLIVVGVGVVASWTYFLSLTATSSATSDPETDLKVLKVPSEAVTVNVTDTDTDTDTERDIELLRERPVNLMNATQLSEAQTADDPPFQICVFAPDPLELHSEQVYASTLAWARRHINEVTTDSAQPSGLAGGSPSMVFWCRRSESVPRALEVVRRLHADLRGDDRVFDLISFVKAPDYLFYVDMTLHRFRDHSIRAYVNAREKGVTNLLVELPVNHATHIEGMLAQWLEEADARILKFQATGAGVSPRRVREKAEYAVRCWIVEPRHLELEPSLEAVGEMFQPNEAEKSGLRLVATRIEN